MREPYPRASGTDLDALVANMGITRFPGETDDQVRRRAIDYVRQPTRFEPIGLRQRTAIWLHDRRMPTFASWLYPGYWWRVSEPAFVGEMPPRWVMEKNVDGGWAWP